MTEWATGLWQADFEDPDAAYAHAFSAEGGNGLLLIGTPVPISVQRGLNNPTDPEYAHVFTATGNALSPSGAARGAYPLTTHGGSPGGTLADQGGGVVVL